MYNNELGVGLAIAYTHRLYGYPVASLALLDLGELYLNGYQRERGIKRKRINSCNTYISFKQLIKTEPSAKSEIEFTFPSITLKALVTQTTIIIIIIYYLFRANIYMNIFKCALQVTLK